ncbi:SCO family protein [Paenibacillus hamazuiensis]|uniref:SCO family protein n=1 Tax=Paenibacillus hamazuiensis TaxID=2936508 RepID=UPI00200C52DF|nr:SCO family protein [Paenibacillus hamazuiensis]
MADFLKKNGFRLVVMALLIGLIVYFALTLMKGKEAPFPMSQPAPAFQMDNYDGTKLSLANLEGKTKLVYFFYSTCPDVCSPTTYQLSKVQDSLVKKGLFGSKTAIVSISFDPTKDTPQQLKDFAANFHADPKGWYFLRGDEQQTIDLAKKYGVMVIKDEKNGTFTHNNAILLVDGKNVIRTYYVGNDPDLDPEKIVEDMVRLSKQ